MIARRSTYAGTSKRQSQIIQAALACFSEFGFSQTTMEDIRRRSGASNGSIYHHFKSKEQLAAAVYVEGIANYQSGLLSEIDKNPNAREGIFAIVRFHLIWVMEHPDWARFLSQMRHAEFMASSETAIMDLNQKWVIKLNAWFARQIESGKIRKLSRELYISIIFGPCQEITRLWLQGIVSAKIENIINEIARAAWQALRSKG